MIIKINTCYSQSNKSGYYIYYLAIIYNVYSILDKVITNFMRSLYI